MNDHETTNVEAAARLAREEAMPLPIGPDWRLAARAPERPSRDDHADPEEVDAS